LGWHPKLILFLLKFIEAPFFAYWGVLCDQWRLYGLKIVIFGKILLNFCVKGGVLASNQRSLHLSHKESILGYFLDPL
jgi:hypothetical protein